jgi:hypothetical protein
MAQLLSPVGAAKCSTGLCHLAGSTSNDLDLSSPGVGMRLVNVVAMHGGVDMEGGVMCPAGVKLVDTANPSASWLLAKINGTQGLCGSPMPQVGTLTSAQKACITSWVMSVSAAVQGDAGTATGGTGGTGAGGSSGSTAIAGTGGTAPAGGSGGAATGGTGGASGSGGSGGASGGASGSAGTGGA